MLQYNTVPCRPERRHISFPRIVGSTMSSVQTSHLLPTYARVDLAFERGEGAWLIATNGDRYLDFTSGVAVNALGHAHPQLVEAINRQAGKVWHVSNLYRIPESERLAERLCAASFADVVFFGNSGAEAMECAIKMARKYQSASGRNVTASSLSRAPSTGARSPRWRPGVRRSISTASARWSKVLTRWRSPI